jgi:glyoxylase-like metal-dependent hydrolase (beta-lactamase superfamily II)
MSSRVTTVVVSRFALDGGAMHGIVPKVLWSKTHAPDAENRIELVARVLVVDVAACGTRTVIDLGLGQRWSEKERRMYAIAPGGDTREALAAGGIDPDTVTHVVLTHLHWDHAGGLLRGQGGALELAFPSSIHVVSQAAVDQARAPSDKDRGSFRADDIAHLFAHGRAVVARPNEELAPGVAFEESNGHTRGLLVPRVRDEDGRLIAFPTDLVPTRSHLRTSWVAAYDNSPEVSVTEKRALFESLASHEGGLVLYHDPLVGRAWPTRSGNDFAWRME